MRVFRTIKIIRNNGINSSYIIHYNICIFFIYSIVSTLPKMQNLKIDEYYAHKHKNNAMKNNVWSLKIALHMTKGLKRKDGK